jgi:hypothetical protein
MARAKSKTKGVVATAKAVPWAIVIGVTAEVARAAREHWNDLPPRDRTRLQELLRKSKGRPDRLSQSERDELVGLARRVDAVGFAKRVAPLLGATALRRATKR